MWTHSVRKFLAGLAISAALFFQGCGGSTPTSDNTQSKFVAESIVTTSLDKVSWHIRDVPYILADTPPTPKNTWFVAVRGLGSDAIQHEVLTDVSDKTGLSSINQVGNSRGLVFQQALGAYGSYIDTTSAPYREFSGSGPQSILSFDISPPIALLDGEKVLNFSFGLKAPLFQSLNGVAQVTYIAYLSDENNSVFAYVFSAYDNRYTTHQLNVMNDLEVAFVAAPFRTTAYGTLTNNSATMTSGTETILQYSISITRENLGNMVRDLNDYCRKIQAGFCSKTFSTNLDSYKIGGVNLLHEVFLFNRPEYYVRSGVSFYAPKLEKGRINP